MDPCWGDGKELSLPDPGDLPDENAGLRRKPEIPVHPGGKGCLREGPHAHVRKHTVRSRASCLSARLRAQQTPPLGPCRGRGPWRAGRKMQDHRVGPGLPRASPPCWMTHRRMRSGRKHFTGWAVSDPLLLLYVVPANSRRLKSSRAPG